MRTLLNIMVTLTMLVGIVGYAQPASAQQKDVTIKIRSIAASKHGDSFDKRLDSLKGQLQKAFGSYTNFKLIDEKSFELAKGKSNTASVPGGTKVTVSFEGTSGDFLRLGLSIADKLSTTLRASPGSTFFQAGLDYKDGMLILAITAK
ncbi:MAG: hypothetical protein ACOC9J_01315 [Persicimonas sp.]